MSWQPEGQRATGLASREGRLKLAGGHHASMEAALIMALAFCVAATASCSWLTQLVLLRESWRDRSGLGKEEHSGCHGPAQGLNVGLRTGGRG